MAGLTRNDILEALLYSMDCDNDCTAATPCRDCMNAKLSAYERKIILEATEETKED